MITYFLKEPKAKAKALISLSYYFQNARIVITTGEKIHPRDWNPLKRRPRNTADNCASLTNYLNKLETKVQEIHLDLRAEFIDVTTSMLKTAVERSLLNRGKKENFMTFIARFIVESKAHRKPGSLSVYTSVEKLLLAFSGPKDFNDINPDWFKKYQLYLEKEGYSANYIGKNVAIIRELITIAKKQGLTKNDQYRDTDYKRPHEEVETIYLTASELLRIYQMPLSDAQDAVRNRFLIGAYTALRFSDSAKITPDSIREGLIFDKAIKTGGSVVVPIHWVIKQIMEDHPDGLPSSISNQKTNEALKVICKEAGINTTIVIRKTQGGKVNATTMFKYQMVTTHTARRSAATNMFLAGIPAISIMKITGHRTESSFMKYIRMSSEENAIHLQDHSYFSKE